jgi:hypothetical protein
MANMLQPSAALPAPARHPGQRLLPRQGESSKTWHAVVADNSTWERLCAARFGSDAVDGEALLPAAPVRAPPGSSM